MKVCSKCKEEKLFESFSKNKNNKDGLQSRCKDCAKQYNKAYYENNREQILEYQKEYHKNNKKKVAKKNKKYRENNKEQIAEYQKEYRENNKEKLAEKSKEYYENNKDVIIEKTKEYHKNNKKKVAKKNKEYRENNKEKTAEYNKEYRENNKEQIAEYQKEYRENNKEKTAEYNKEYRENHPEKVVNQQAVRRQREKNAGDGITKEEWLEVMHSTDWVCFYCNTSLSKNNRTIDHIIPICRGGPHIKENLVPACKSCNSSKNSKIGNEWRCFNSLPLNKQKHIYKIIDKYSHLIGV